MAGTSDEWQEDQKTYRAFLLRCWLESDCLPGRGPEEIDNWRFAIVEVNSRSLTKCFTSLEELIVHLRDQLKHVARDVATHSDLEVRDQEDPLNSSSDVHLE